MKHINRRRVIEALRKLNLKRYSTGNGTSHQVWKDEKGHTCHPKLTSKTINLASVYCLGNELETNGICQRRIFMQIVNQS